jgi:5-deoxy-glucuronate isomerase
MYFLNVLAGPAETRSMAFSDDPDKHWIRENWNTQTQDPRLPWTSATPRKR